MERLTLGGRGTVADRVGGRNDRSAGRHGARTGWLVARRRSPRLPIYQKAKPSARSLERGEDGASSIPRRSRTQAGPAPPQPRGHSPPRSEAEGSAAAADVLARQREQPTGGYGTPKGTARCVPWRVRNEPPRADIVTSARRPNNHGASTGGLPAGRLPQHGEAARFAPSSRQHASAGHRRCTEGLAFVATRVSVRAWTARPTLHYRKDAVSFDHSNFV